MTANNTYTDQELLKLLSQDNRQAFDMLYSRHWEDMYKAAFFILRDPGACKDIVQDIFIWFWEHRHTLEVLTLKSYLRAAVKFKVANYIRSGNIREGFFNELAGFKSTVLVPSAEELMEIKQLKAIIRQAISDLPEKCQEIFRLSREEHLSNQEIANKLHISVKTVENQMTIALRRIRRAIDPYMATAPVLTFICLHQHFS